MHLRRLVALTLVVSCAGLFAAASPATAAAPPQRAPTMFVLRGATRGGPHRLTVDTGRVEWFTDRPVRRAGVMTPQALVRGWQGWGFDHDAPNAALTGNKLDVVVELSKPRVHGGTLSFNVTPVRGKLPRGNLGPVSTFVDATSAGSTSTSTVHIVNNSGQQTSAYVFVTASNSEPQENMMSTVWLQTPVYAGGSQSLMWDSSTQLMAAPMGVALPGTTFAPQEVLPVPPAGPGQSGTADLAGSYGGFTLTPDPTQAAPPGSLAVQSEPSVPQSELVAAMGISGSPALVAQALANETTTFPATGLTYWLAAAPFIQTGQILPQYQTQNAVQLTFPAGVTSLTATLNPDGTWTVQPSSS